MISKKRLYLYVILLVLVVTAMIMLRNFLTGKSNQIEVNDYNEIIERGEMNVVTDYNTIGYFVSGDTIQGFQYEDTVSIDKIFGSWFVNVSDG